MRCLAFMPCLSLLLLLSQFFYAGYATTFTCNATATATCRGLVGYVVPNATTYGHIQTLFQVDALYSLLGANNLELSTPATQPVEANSTVFVPFPCRCVNGTGNSDGVPVYKVTANDSGLDAIARYTFDQFVTYEEIATANNISAPYAIKVGEELYIPLPCSCDPVNGEEVAHLGHVVAKGSSVNKIAAEFGVDNTTLLRLNGISDPTKLLAGQTLDVPLRVCSSSIGNSSPDYDFMRLPNNSYARTAGNCIFCSCNADTYQLDCKLNGSAACPARTCGSRRIGNTTTSGCETTTCAYAGYTNSSANGIEILATTAITNQTKCSGSLELKVSKRTGLLIFLQMAFISLFL